MSGVDAILLTIVTAATPLLLAAIGELVVERTGVLNLGVEGMMILGAIAGFIGAHETGSVFVGAVTAAFGGMVLAALFGVLTITLLANQVATGLALTLLGLGLSGMIGEAYIGEPGIRVSKISIPVLSDLPFIGTLLLSLDPLVYLSIAITVAVSVVLFRTRAGLVIRAVGDNPASAHALGYSVVRVRFLAVLFGGAMAGLAGGYLSLAYTPQWIEGMTAGRGWIALALVVFASWLPGRVAVGAYLFGTVMIMQFHAQAAGVAIPSQFLSSLPYIATIVVLVVISRNRTVTRTNTPASLGRPFAAEK